MDTALCEYAEQLTLNPGDANAQQIVKLQELGLSDRAILDASLVISYFNFVNRMVLGLGVHLDGEEVRGYQYD